MTEVLAIRTAETVVVDATPSHTVTIVDTQTDTVEIRGETSIVVVSTETVDTLEVGRAGPQGIAGPPGPPGPPGLTHVHDQAAAADTWVIVHNLGAFPNLTIVDSSGAAVIGDETYDSPDQITVRFSAPFSGKAYLS